MSPKKKYVIVGASGRAGMYYQAIADTYKTTAKLVGLCDVNQTRMGYVNNILTKDYNARAVKTYGPNQFSKMINEQKPDTVIVTTIDRVHHKYIISAMELGCNVITEKPMTVDQDKCQQIVDVVKRTKKKLLVTFNYRYAPHNTKVRELVMDDVIGKVYSVHLEWLLDIHHGADYFRRWHRDKRNSGGLMVHKATHHFDLVNFWLDSRPETVFGFGDLKFYGRANAENRGITKFYSRAHGNKNAKGCKFALHLDQNPNLKAMYLDAEHEDGYFRDQSVFGDGISIEDTMNLVVKYKNKAQMSYSLHAYSPWEGYNVSLNGPKGKIELTVRETSYVNAGGTVEGPVKTKQITVFPMFAKPYTVKIPEAKGGHGGGDTVLLEELFGKPKKDRFKRSASYVDGAMSILTGIAANISFNTGQPVNIDNLVKF